jgi:hypothetical protein
MPRKPAWLQVQEERIVGRLDGRRHTLQGGQNPVTGGADAGRVGLDEDGHGAERGYLAQRQPGAEADLLRLRRAELHHAALPRRGAEHEWPPVEARAAHHLEAERQVGQPEARDARRPTAPPPR